MVALQIRNVPDGAYVALAADVGIPLLTADRRLAEAARDVVQVIEV